MLCHRQIFEDFFFTFIQIGAPFLQQLQPLLIGHLLCSAVVEAINTSTYGGVETALIIHDTGTDIINSSNIWFRHDVSGYCSHSKEADKELKKKASL